jgi:hypothetical protein
MSVTVNDGWDDVLAVIRKMTYDVSIIRKMTYDISITCIYQVYTWFIHTCNCHIPDIYLVY